MEPLSRGLSIFFTCTVCLTIAVTTALPIALGSLEEYNGDIASSNLFDSCTLCYTFSDTDACALCNYGLTDSSLAEKRSGRYHPFLRGTYPKKNYFPYYNPLNRGSYFKKSNSPTTRVYHPFLRGGYRGPILPQRTYWNTDDVEDES